MCKAVGSKFVVAQALPMALSLEFNPFNILLVHTYNMQEASREAINAAFSREVDSLVSL